MSIEKIDEYISETEAIEFYDQVKEQLEAAKLEIGKIAQENDTLTQRVRELEHLKTNSEGKTIAEIERTVLAERDEEIVRRAEAKLAELKKSWERTDKPKEVVSEALSMLSSIIKSLSSARSTLVLKQVLETGMREEVIQILNTEVNRRMDEEFERGVDQRSNLIVLEKLEILKNIEWPKFFEANVIPRAELLSSELRSNAMQCISGPWTLSCDKCGTMQTAILDPDQIASLLRDGRVDFVCTNPKCVDYAVFPHSFPLALDSLIASFLIT